MTELKTLKDLENDPTKETSILTIDNIKAEAVKWIKDVERRKCFSSKSPDCETATIIMRRFFNLTEEDLK